MHGMMKGSLILFQTEQFQILLWSPSLSLHFNGHFPGGLGLASTRMSSFWILLELRVIDFLVEHELKMNRTEMSMIRWMCGVKLNERKKSEELRELLGLELVSLMIKKSRLMVWTR